MAASVPTRRRLAACAAAGVMAFAACASSTSTPAGSTAGGSEQGSPAGTGKKVVGILVGGSSKDNGFWQAIVDKGKATARSFGWSTIVVDGVKGPDTQQATENLARQGVDVVAAVLAESADGVATVAADPRYQKIDFIVLGFDDPPTRYYSTVISSTTEINYMAGVAAGLVLKRRPGGASAVGYVSGPELDFSKQAADGLQAGLRSQIPAGRVIQTFTGDFENSGLAVEALRAQEAKGIGMVYPYLGGATDAVVQEANATRIEGISPGTDRCGDRKLRFAVSALFDNGIFLSAALQKIEDGTFREGQQIFLQVGRDKDVGAKICDATPAEQKTLDDLAARIAAKQVDVAAEIRKLG